MKKLLVLLVAALFAVTGVAATGCNQGEKNIRVILREASSGTREAFEKVVKKGDVSLNDITEGETDEYSFVKDHAIANVTANVITEVENNENAIGYVSLASVGSSVKALKVEGVTPTTQTVQDGDYAIQRPFLLLTRTDGKITPAAQDFYNFCMSELALEEIDSEGLVQDPNRTPGTYEKAELSGSPTIKVSGSSSMREVMTRLVLAYEELQPNVNVEQSYTGSGSGRSDVEKDTDGATIGLASSSSPNPSVYVEHTLCLDAVAVIVNKKNNLSDITIEQLFDIYTGAIMKFSELEA